MIARISILLAAAASLLCSAVETDFAKKSYAKNCGPRALTNNDSEGRSPLNKSKGSPASDISLPSGRYCSIESPGGIRVDAAVLIWQAKMWGLEYAAKSFIPTNSGTSAVSLKEKAYLPDFAWRPGFKVDVGYDFDFDGWDLDSRYTAYRGEDTMLKKNFHAAIGPPGTGMIPLWFYPFYNVVSPNQIRFTDSAMKWTHYFNSFDLEIGRSSSPATRLSMRLFGGLKGAWMHQYYHVTYANGTSIAAIVPGTSGTVPFTLLESAAAFKNEIWGVGPRAGAATRWEMLWGIRLVADAALSLLYSGIKTIRDQNDLNLNTSTGLQQPLHVHINTNSHQLKPVVETKLGIDWVLCIGERSEIGAMIAYELQYWWAQNELRRNYSHAAPGNQAPMRGDLQMHGLTAQVGYAY